MIAAMCSQLAGCNEAPDLVFVLRAPHGAPIKVVKLVFVESEVSDYPLDASL